MYQRKESTNEASLAELLSIETLRGLESNEPRFLPSVDMPLARRVDRQDTGNADAMAKVLAERADSILRAEYGLGKSAIAAAVKWLWWIRIIFVGFVAASAAGICGRVLLASDADHTVSVEGFVWFLALDLLMAIPPVLLMLAALIGHQSHGEGRSGPTRFIAEILENLGKALTAFYWVVLAATGLIQKHLLSRAFPNAHSTEKIERFSEAMGALVSGQSHLLLRAVAMTSHLCWTIVCSVVLICFFASTTFRGYDFQWHSTWLDQSGKLRWLENGAVPIRWLPLTPAPDEHLVAYLSSDVPTKGTEYPPAPLNAEIVDLARITEECEGRVRVSSDKIGSTDAQDKGIEKQRREGIGASKEYLHGLDGLIAGIRDDANAMQLIGNQGQETLHDLEKQLRELRATAEERKMRAEELLFSEATNGGVTKLQSPAGRIYGDWHNLGKSLTDINRTQQAAAREVYLRSKARASCAHLMAAFLLYYGILPRLLLLVIARIQLTRSLRAIRPSLTSPYIAQIIANLKKPPMGPSPEPALPTLTSPVPVPFSPPANAVRIAANLNRPPLGTSPEPAPLPPASPASVPPVLSAGEPPSSLDDKPGEMAFTATPTAPPEHPLTEPPAPQPPRTLSAVFGYEVEVPADGWDGTIPISALGEVVDLGNAVDRKSRNRAITELGRLAPKIRFLTIVIDLIGSPDNQFVNFLHTAIASLPADAVSNMVILLSDGDGLRVKFSDDAERIRARVRLWRAKIAECGVHEDHIFEFDHLVATPHSRRELLNRLEAIRGKGFGEVLQPSLALHLAGRFPQASKLICAAAKTVADYCDADQFASETRKLHQKIHDLYQQEATWLSRTCAAIGGTPDSLPPLVAAGGDQASAALDKLQEGAISLMGVGRETVQQARQWWSRFRGYAGGLSGRWAIAGGLAAALGGSLAGVPAIATVWLLAAGAAFGSQLPLLKQKLICLLPFTTDKETGTADAQVAAATICLDDLVRTNVVWALVLELQGNSEETIAKTLQCLLTDCCPGLLGAVSETQELLDQVEQRLRLLPATEPV